MSSGFSQLLECETGEGKSPVTLFFITSNPFAKASQFVLLTSVYWIFSELPSQYPEILSCH